MAQNEKCYQYAAILTSKIGELFDENFESDKHIDFKELKDGDNLTQFFHALANIMPTHIFNKFMEERKNNLEFNHIANQLVFQYSKKED